MNLEENLKKILIIDYGSQFTQLIARRIRELGVFSEIVSHKKIKNENICENTKGIILLHDCLPNSIYEQAVPRCYSKWNGDVWKAIVEMRTKEDI